ncbi:hypothetical protein LFL96_10475 [Paraburkholderia sp. D15]|nr:hypothetical protein [Paraburkholderia sp. D15]WGS48233.1 hypothetical protein LFL96_10475 [Paraburkholderia sp. D15]WKF56106.1 hypothetical protein HUO10_000553 [Paraburkholderia busanensis]
MNRLFIYLANKENNERAVKWVGAVMIFNWTVTMTILIIGQLTR